MPPKWNISWDTFPASEPDEQADDPASPFRFFSQVSLPADQEEDPTLRVDADRSDCSPPAKRAKVDTDTIQSITLTNQTIPAPTLSTFQRAEAVKETDPPARQDTISPLQKKAITPEKTLSIAILHSQSQPLPAAEIVTQKQGKGYKCKLTI